VESPTGSRVAASVSQGDGVVKIVGMRARPHKGLEGNDWPCRDAEVGCLHDEIPATIAWWLFRTAADDCHDEERRGPIGYSRHSIQYALAVIWLQSSLGTGSVSLGGELCRRRRNHGLPRQSKKAKTILDEF
jgi:hypothetical protein